jgi:hypothetical protein
MTQIAQDDNALPQHLFDSFILPDNFIYSENPYNPSERDEPYHLGIATDSEWDGVSGEWLSTTFCVDALGVCRYYHFLNENLGDRVISPWDFLSKLHWDYFLPTSDGQFDKLLKHVLEMELKLHVGWRNIPEVDLLFYYSPKDLEYALGWEFMKPLYESGKVTQKRNIKGAFDFNITATRRGEDGSVTEDCHKVKINLVDQKGWGNGLNDFATSLCLEIPGKSLMDDCKGSMRKGYIERPDDAFIYARGDVDILFKTRHEFTKLVQTVRELVGVPVPEGGWDAFEVLPATTGSLVSSVFLEWLKTRCESPEVLDYALKKLGVLNDSHEKYQRNRKLYSAAVETLKTRQTLNDAIANNTPTWEGFEKCSATYKAFEYTALSQCSVKYFAKRDTSAAFNALVQGGRCNNERPSEYRVEYGADIDLSGCYGNALRDFRYPLGLPTVWAFQSNQTPHLTLGKWLTKYNPQLVDGLWTATVSTPDGVPLNFNQDLVYSKIVTREQINRAAWGGDEKESTDPDRDDDLAHIPGDFALIRKEIQNGIITSEVLKVIKAVATSQEMKQLMGLELVSAAAYLKKDECETVEKWIDAVIESKGKLVNRNGLDHQRLDRRSRKWVGVLLEGFIGVLVDERGEIKRQMKLTTDEREKATLKAKQNGIKLFINTLYGDLASPYFEIGNTLLANNITAKARVGTWMMNKALHTRQSITDGGIYTPCEVPFLNPEKRGGKVPGFAALADNTRWRSPQRHSDRNLGAMGGKDWKAAIAANDESVLEQLDALATAHINAFWGHYHDDLGVPLQLPFKIEHKLDNTFTVAAYTSKAHYTLRTRTGKGVYKIRGAKEYKSEEYRKSPMFEVLKNILDSSGEMPSEMGYDHFSLLKVAKYLQCVNSSNDEAYTAVRGKRPGDAIVEGRTMRLNNTHFPCDTVGEFKRRKDRKTKQSGEPAQWFERHREKGFKRVHSESMKEAKYYKGE